MRERVICLEDRGISRERARELTSFVRQHEEKRAQIRRGLWTHEDVSRQRRDVAMVEDLARRCGGVMAAQLLENLIHKTPYEHLMIPCGREKFYRMRREFFVLLDAARG